MTRPITFYYLLIINTHAAMLGACRPTSQSAANSTIIIIYYDSFSLIPVNTHPQTALKNSRPHDLITISTVADNRGVEILEEHCICAMFML